MRDPRRIARIAANFIRIWVTYPDMRFGQLYMNLTRGHWAAGNDVWNIEDDKLEEGIAYYDKHGTFPTLGAAPTRRSSAPRI